MTRRNSFIALYLVLSLLATLASVACTPGNAANLAKDNNAVIIQQAEGVTGQEANEVRKAAEATICFFAEEYAMGLREPVLILLTRDRQAYIGEVAEKFRLSKADAEHKTLGTHALSGGRLIVVDISGIPSFRQKTFLIAHELTHYYLRQIAGNRAGKVRWIQEGMAEAVGAQVVAGQGELSLEQYRENWRRALERAGNGPGLQELESSQGWSASISRWGSFLTYKTSGLATFALIERFGWDKLIGYFSALGQGAEPEAAFKTAFGITGAEFAIDFACSIQAVDKDLSMAAISFLDLSRINNKP